MKQLKRVPPKFGSLKTKMAMAKEAGCPVVTVQRGPRPRNVATSRQEMVTKVSHHGPLATRVPAQCGLRRNDTFRGVSQKSYNEVFEAFMLKYARVSQHFAYLFYSTPGGSSP